MVLVLRHCQPILSVKTTIYLIPSLLWLVLIHVELRNCPVLCTITFGLLPVCTVVLSDFILMLKCSWLWSLLPNGSCITTLPTNYFCEDNNIHNILSALVGYNTC